VGRQPGASKYQMPQGVPEVWTRWFGSANTRGLRARSFGIGGDSTGYLLWWLKNWRLDGATLAPKVTVLLIGTNDLTQCDSLVPAHILRHPGLFPVP